MFRYALLLSLTSLSTVALASYELMLAADAGGRIHRYDIQNNVYLGSFGSFQLPFAETVVARASTGEAYVEYQNRIHRFNFHTGEYKGSVATGFFDVKHMSLMNDGRLMVTHSTGSHAIDPITGTVGFALNYVAGDVPIGAVQMASGRFMALSRFTGASTTYYTNRFSVSGGLESSASFQTTTSFTDQYLGVGKVGDRVLYWGDDATSVFNGFARVATEAGVVTPVGSSTTEAPTFIATSGMTHTGTLVTVGSSISGSSYINRVYMSSSAIDYGFAYTSMVLPMTTRISSVDVVLAPEPGAMAALALGGLALLRRRRKSAA